MGFGLAGSDLTLTPTLTELNAIVTIQSTFLIFMSYFQVAAVPKLTSQLLFCAIYLEELPNLEKKRGESHNCEKTPAPYS